MVLAYNTSPLSGLASGIDKIANAYAVKKRNQGLSSGLQQIQSGNWESGIKTIAEQDPEVALGLVNKKMEQERENQITPYQERYLNYLEGKDKQEGNNPFSSKNEFINLLGIRNNAEVWDKLPDDQKSLVNARLNYMSNNPENIYDTSYQKKSGTLQAERESKNLENQQISQQQQGKMLDAINLVDTLPDNLFRPDTELMSKIGIYGGEYGVGLDEEENKKYGYLERTIGTIENDLIQKARSKGQVGINTIAEIRQAAKGLQLGRGKERLKGALQAMYEIEQRLDAMPTIMTMIPQNTQLTDYSNASDDEILQGLK